MEIKLTEKEKKFIELKAQGLKMEEIANQLYLSLRYAENFASDLYTKTGCRNGSSLVYWGFQNGILKINAENSSSEVRKTG